MLSVNSFILKEMTNARKSSNTDIELEITLKASPSTHKPLLLQPTPQSILNQFVKDWEIIQQKDASLWYEHEWSFVKNISILPILPILKFILQNRPLNLAWYLYQKRLQTSLEASDLEIDLLMPLYGAHRFDLKGSYRCVGDGQHVERCLRPEIRIHKQGVIVLRLDGEVKIN